MMDGVVIIDKLEGIGKKTSLTSSETVSQFFALESLYQFSAAVVAGCTI